jgi:hypothetical protein
LKRYRNRVIIRYNYEMISKLILKEAKWMRYLIMQKNICKRV